MENLKCFLIVNPSLNSQIYIQPLIRKQETALQNEARYFLNEIQEIILQVGEQQKAQTSQGIWYFIPDKKKNCFCVLTVEGYPARHAFNLIKEIISYVDINIPDYYFENEQQISLAIQKQVTSLGNKFDDLKNIDEMYSATAQIEDVRLVMEDNVNRLMNNAQKLDVIFKDIEYKSSVLEKGANELKSGSTSLAKIMYWRNMKLKIIIAVLILAVLLYILVPIISHFKSDDDNSNNNNNNNGED